MREQQQQKSYKYCQKLNCSSLFETYILTRQIILSPKNSQEFLASQVSFLTFSVLQNIEY